LGWDPETIRRDGLPYSTWIRRGLITATEGNVTDYSQIREQIVKEIWPRFQIKEIAFDPYGATEMVSKLMVEGLTMVEFRQNTQTFNEPTQKLEALVTSRRLDHAGHAVLRAHAASTTVKLDLNKTFRSIKERDTGRIDGIVALIMALSRSLRKQPDPFVYIVRGLREI
jgi:phage terminase large subunit-like protein